MLVKIENLYIHYKILGGGRPLILLHGWGNNMASLMELGKLLAKSFQVYLVDLPGFGLSSIPPTVYGSETYASIVEEFMRSLAIANPIIIGHSFGGKIAIQLAVRKKAEKIILLGSSGIQLPKPWRTKLKIHGLSLLKFLARLPMVADLIKPGMARYQRKFGSTDYVNATGMMRKILVKTVAESVLTLLPNIEMPTLLIWGSLDQETPPIMGEIMQKYIPNAKLQIIPQGGHLLCTDSPHEVWKLIDDFLA